MNEGWYPDPLSPARQRYWRGNHWGADVYVDGAVHNDGLLAPSPVSQVTETTELDLTSLHVVGEEPTLDEPSVPVPGWWLPLVIAALSFGFIFLPQTSEPGDTGYGFKDGYGEFDWGAAWPFLVGIGVLIVGAMAGRAGRTGLAAIASGAALYIAVGMFLIYSFVIELIFSGLGVSPGPGAFCVLAACATSLIYAVTTLRTSGRIEAGTTPIGFSVVVTCAAGGVALLLVSLITENSAESFWSESGWMNAALVAFLAPNGLNIIWPVIRSNSPAIGLVGGFTSLYAVDYVVTLIDGDTSPFVGDSSLGGLAVLTVACGGVLLALLYDRVLTSATGLSYSDRPARSTGAVAIAAVLTGSLFVLWLANLDESESWSTSCSGSACNYGDDLFRLYAVMVGVGP